ncbi:MAG: pelota family protein [Pyrobaculum sp.]|nr:pelota family protein [Pyrobaculum sp.]
MKYDVDVRRRVIKILPEREEDLYFVYLLIDRGDVVRGWTVREYKPDGVKEGERVKMYLAVKVEAVEYHKFRGSLRVRGPVVEVQTGVEGVKGKRHTFDVVPGREIEIEKTGDHPLDGVAEVLNMAKVTLPRILLISIDDEEAAFAYITALGAEILHVFHNMRKEGENLLEEFVAKVGKYAEEFRQRYRPDIIVLAGPGMIVDYASRYVQGEKSPQSSGGLAGVYEFMRQGLYEKLKDEMGIESYQRLLHKLATNRDAVAIGPEEVGAAASIGRVETLLILDTYIKESPEDAWRLISQVYKTKGRIFILREETEAGAGLKAMGNIAALLRW